MREKIIEIEIRDLEQEIRLESGKKWRRNLETNFIYQLKLSNSSN